MGWDAPTPGWIWSVSPLDYAAADRILKTNGLPIAVSEADYYALCTAFAGVALMGVDFLMRPRMPPETLRTYMESATTLMKAAAVLRSFPSAPPPVPASWMREYMDWLDGVIAIKAEEGETSKRKGAPANALNSFLYPYLLGVYVVAYGRSPATTAGGPTERFFGAFLETLTKVMRTLKWDGDPSVIAAMPDMVAPFVRPSSAALCKRIRSFVDAEDIQAEFVRLMMEQLSAEPESPMMQH